MPDEEPMFGQNEDTILSFEVPGLKKSESEKEREMAIQQSIQF
mgnify:CR=1 FL=1